MLSMSAGSVLFMYNDDNMIYIVLAKLTNKKKKIYLLCISTIGCCKIAMKDMVNYGTVESI